MGCLHFVQSSPLFTKRGVSLVEIKRKLYKRGSSFETTIPMPLLFSIDKSKKQNVVFEFDESSNRWYIKIVEASDE